MQFQLTGDETLSTGFKAAKSVIEVTADNADEIAALNSMHKGVYLDDTPVVAAPGDVGPVVAQGNAKNTGGLLSLSEANPIASWVAGDLFARVRSRGFGTVTLTDNGGGRVALSGRSLISTGIPFVTGQPVTIKLMVDGIEQSFVLVPMDPAEPSVAGDPTYRLDYDGSYLINPDGSFLLENI